MRQTTIRLSGEELLADISGRLSLLAKAYRTEDGDTHDTEDALDDGNREMVQNTVARLFYETANLLYPFCKSPLRSPTADGRARGADEYVLLLQFPYERSEGQVRELAPCVHDYIVQKCVAEWLSLTLPQSDWQTWEQRAQQTRERIGELLVTPLNPKRLRVRPHLF